jgi:hypothetical protein
MFDAPTEGTLKDFMEFSDTGFADHEQSPPHQRTHAAEHYAKLTDRIRRYGRFRHAGSLPKPTQVRVCLNDLLPNFRSRVEVRPWRVLGKAINPEGRFRLIFCRSIRRENLGHHQPPWPFHDPRAEGRDRTGFDGCY